MNEENLQLLKVVGSKEPEYIVALVEGGGDISSLGKIVEAPFGGWIYYFPANASWHLSLEIGNLLQITDWILNLNKHGSPEMFSEEDAANAAPCAESDELNYPTRDLDTPRPYWANWLARDQDGRWHWFEYRPEWSPNSDEWFEAKDVPIRSRVEVAGFSPHSGTPAEYSIYYVGPKGEDNE